MSVTILEGGLLIGGLPLPRVLAGDALAWEGEHILATGTAAGLRQRWPAARRLDANGGLILPGLVNLHHHFYSRLACGLDPGLPMRSFGERLERLWWRLDRALDPDAVRLSAELCLLECIRSGCTTVFDHHSSPGCIDGSLDLIAEAVERLGLSAALCYEVSDRNGRAEAQAGLDENRRFAAACRGATRTRAMLGLHASFTLSEETLERAADLAELGAHIHAGEDPIDVERSLARFGREPLERLEAHGLLNERAVLVHGIHLSPVDLERAAKADALVVMCSESNANNAVGQLDLGRVAAAGCRVALGSDGMGSSMLRALRASFLARRACGSPDAGFRALPTAFPSGAWFAARRFFDEPLLGELVAGAPADMAVVDYRPATPLDADNLHMQLVHGAAEAAVRHTVARGRSLLEDFELVVGDPARLAAEAETRTPELWARFAALEPGPFMGQENR